jgi:hypothetical protein
VLLSRITLLATSSSSQLGTLLTSSTTENSCSRYATITGWDEVNRKAASASKCSTPVVACDPSFFNEYARELGMYNRIRASKL